MVQLQSEVALRLPILPVLLSFSTFTLNGALTPTPTASQTEEDTKRLVLEVTPSRLEVEVGQKLQLTAKVTTGSGESADAKVVFFSSERRRVEVSATGEVSAYKPGQFTIYALVPKDVGDRPGRKRGRGWRSRSPFPPLRWKGFVSEGSPSYSIPPLISTPAPR